MLRQRSSPVKSFDKKVPVVFQAISWHAQDIDFVDIDSEENPSLDHFKYVIKVFGSTQDGTSVGLTVKDFTPYFFVKMPPRWTMREIKAFQDHIFTILPFRQQHHLLAIKKVKKKDFWGFTNFHDFDFLRLSFRSHRAMRKVVRNLENKQVIRQISNAPIKLDIYESNIDPYIRFTHLNNIEPCGWITVQPGKFKTCHEILPSKCQIDLEARWTDVEPYSHDTTAPFLIASFDIECTSNTGDFPVPIKKYRKLAYELYDLYHKLTTQGANNFHKCESVKNGIFHALGIPHTTDEIDEKYVNLYRDMVTRVEPKYKLSDQATARIISQTKIKIDEICDMINGKIPIGQDLVPNRDKRITWLSRKLSSKTYLGLPDLQGDPIIQIGTTYHRYGESQCCYKSIITLGSCDPIEGVDVEECETEEDMLLKWKDLILETNPDVITGYNIFGFDFSYMMDRCKELGIEQAFMQLSKFKEYKCRFMEQRLSSSALGDNFLKYVEMPGRVLIDLMKVIQRDHKLDSYKLDLVAHHFMKMNKHDVSPQDINRLQRGTSADRRVIADYCVQDCTLCNHLMMKLEIIANNMGMSNVCLVPLSFIFMRGQGIKIFSLVLKECKDEGFLIPVKKPANQNNNPPPWLRPKQKDDSGSDEEPPVIEMPLNKPAVKDGSDDDSDDEDDSYEGAIVLPPKEGIYINEPVSVLDYASLYPSSMISENLSHDCIVIDPHYDNLPGVEYLEICYDLYEGKGDKKQKCGEKVCKFVQLPDNRKGVIPGILNKLLKARKATRKKMEWQRVVLKDTREVTGIFQSDIKFLTSDGASLEINKDDIVSMTDYFNEFQLAVLDGLQLAYKVTANSLYGQIGAKTSPIYLKDIAACTTATGRNMILKAKDFLEKNYNANVIYGDTDSLFLIFPDAGTPEVNTNTNIGKLRILPSIATAIKASKEFKQHIKPPHDAEYEKTFWPFILLSKKRYVGNLYEHDDKKCKQKSMGIVLKRRDNAPIVKHVYGGVIDIILNKQDIKASIDFMQQCLTDLIDGKVPLEQLVISKQLKSEYKDPTRIAHKVLAERIGERDPGNKPQVNDRIQYIYVKTPAPQAGAPKVKILQGERIETPEYIKANNLTPDYGFYITNQLMKPLLQVYAIVLDQISVDNIKNEDFDSIYKKLVVEYEGNEKKAKDKLSVLKEKQVEKLLFEPVLKRLLPPDAKVRKSRAKTLLDYWDHVKM